MSTSPITITIAPSDDELLAEKYMHVLLGCRATDAVGMCLQNGRDEFSNYMDFGEDLDIVSDSEEEDFDYERMAYRKQRIEDTETVEPFPEKFTKEKAMYAATALVSPVISSPNTNQDASPSPKPLDITVIIDQLTKCTICSPVTKFDTRRGAAQHVNSKHGKEFCPVCFELYPRGNLLDHLKKERHLRSLWNDKIDCGFCSKRICPLRLMRHLNEVHFTPVEANEQRQLRELQQKLNWGSSRSVRSVNTPSYAE